MGKGNANSPALVRAVSDGTLTVAQIAERTGLTVASVAGVLQRHPDIPRRARGLPAPKRVTQGLRVDAQVRAVSDGRRTRAEVAELTGLTPAQVQKSWSRNPDIPRPNEGAQPGDRNHQFHEGRIVDPDGYAWVSVPADTPGVAASSVRGQWGRMFEHRLVMQQKLGRPLAAGEVVDHLDGLTLHNDPDNLRLFASNAAHLQATIRGQVPRWSPEGLDNMALRYADLPVPEQVHTYGLRRKSGDVRLLQILRLALKLGPDSPFLLGTSRHTKKAGIDLHDRPTTERALAYLWQLWEAGRTR